MNRAQSLERRRVKLERLDDNLKSKASANMFAKNMVPNEADKSR